MKQTLEAHNYLGPTKGPWWSKLALHSQETPETAGNISEYAAHH